VLFALGIRYVGERTAEILAEQFGSMDRILAATEEELIAVEGIGPKIGASVYETLQSDRYRDMIARLRDAGVNMTQGPDGASDLALAGTSWVFTGSLERWTRQIAEERIKSLGGSVADAVTKKTTHVVVGAAPGSKAQRAEQLGVPILDEAAFEAIAGPPAERRG
jgi:DNA ligase (NAD+)